jgi:putative membrane-bound dehydrogenase-like protein
VALLALVITRCSISTTEEANQLNTIQVSPGFEVELVAGPGLVDYPMFATLDETGRLFVFESTGNVYETSEQAVEDPQFRIKLLEDKDGDGKYDKSTVFADHLSFPQGGVFVNGSLIATSAPDLLKLTDTDGDGIADEREVLLSGWILNVNANSLIGPFQGPDGWLYFTSAIMGFEVISQKGEQMKGETARIWKVRPNGSDLQWVAAGGMNNPVELAFTPAGEVIGTQTFFVDPQRGLRDAITYWTEGGVYGKKNSNITRDGLPLTGDLMPVVTQYSRVAPSGIGIYRSSSFGEDFKDNYFSAQFNTHQVVRHQLSRKGASFKTEDELFLWSENEDFHPTDVLEDADGSLLVVETGGWFIKGCPLSRVSKPQLNGGIYRIRRVNTSPVEDPYGNDIYWAGIAITELAIFLEDPRPFVSDRAQSELIAKGNAAIKVFGDALKTSSSVDFRTKAVYGLYRINTNKSWEAVKKGFVDDHMDVRVATAKVAGLTGDARFVDLLTGMLSNDDSR